MPRYGTYPCSPGSLCSLKQVPSSSPWDSWSAPASSPSWVAQQPLCHCHDETSANLSPSEWAHCDAYSWWGVELHAEWLAVDHNNPEQCAANGDRRRLLFLEQINWADGWMWLFIYLALATFASHLKSFCFSHESWDWFHKAPSKMDHFSPVIQGWKSTEDFLKSASVLTWNKSEGAVLPKSNIKDTEAGLYAVLVQLMTVISTELLLPAVVFVFTFLTAAIVVHLLCSGHRTVLEHN